MHPSNSSEVTMTDYVAAALMAKPAEVTVVSSVPVTANIAKVEIDVFPPNAKREQVTASMLRALAGRGAPVSDSFLWYNDAKTRAVGYVTASKELREATPEVLSSMQPMNSTYQSLRERASRGGNSGNSDTVTATNIYMDQKDQSLWQMVDGPNGKFLSKATSDDFHGMLKEVASKGKGRHATASTQPMHVFQGMFQGASRIPGGNESCHIGDFVTYVTNTRTPAISSGVVVAKRDTGALEVMDQSGHKHIALPGLVTAATSTRDVLTASALDLSLPIEEYYKRAYCLPDMEGYVQKILAQIGDAIAA